MLEEQEEEALKAGAKADIFDEPSEEDEPEEGDDLDAVNDLPLHRACGRRHAAREKCLDEGANVVETDENGCCALFLAAERAHVDCMRLLLQHGAGVDQAANHGAPTPSVLQRPRTRRALLDKGADLMTYQGRTARGRGMGRPVAFAVGG